LKSLLSKENPYWTFDDLIKMLDYQGIKSTFFFLNETIKFNPISVQNWPLSLGRYNINDSTIISLIRDLDKKGHEIGVHGSYNSFNDLELLMKEKLTLEKILNRRIFGIRQHHLNLNENTWKIQKQLGFKYDASWGLNKDFGFKDNQIKPFKPFNDEFLVIPMTIMDRPFVTHPNKWDKLEGILDEIEEIDGTIVLNWHTDSLNKNEFPDYFDDLVRIIELLKSRKASFLTVYELYQNYICAE
jgi:peptidoglycan/xylan/chitin deacetylase (PgdA/CDA1 family)